MYISREIPRFINKNQNITIIILQNLTRYTNYQNIQVPGHQAPVTYL